jgi:micrococcal nuclease
MSKLFPLLFSFFFTIVYTQTYTGKIVRVIDGDELNFQTDDSTFTVHLYGVVAPKKGQYFYTQAINHLEKYLWNDAGIQIKKNINVNGTSAILFINGNNINIDMVKNGYAFYDRPRSIDPELARAEEHASKKKLGLWRIRSIVTPWEFKEGILPKPPPTDGKINVLICADSDSEHFHKKYCRELQSCQGNVIVILRKQAKGLHMKPCRHCY